MSEGHAGFQWRNQGGDAAGLEPVTVQLNGEHAKRHEPHGHEQSQMLELFHRRSSIEVRKKNFDAFFFNEILWFFLPILPFGLFSSAADGDCGRQ